MRIDEKDIERRFAKQIREMGGFCIKMSWLLHIPDRLVLLPGAVIEFLEFKKPGGQVTKGQKARIAQLKEMGFKARIIENELQSNCALTRLSKASSKACAARKRKRAVPGDGPGEDADDT